MPRKTSEKTLFGDFQTPLSLAREVVGLAARQGSRPASIVEPTCGKGAFLVAARERFPEALLVGLDTNEEHVAEARAALGERATVTTRDFFGVGWDEELAKLPRPILLLGNPPWVTNAAVGRLGGKNLPVKTNDRRVAGLRAITGSSNFDISEWMLRALLRAGFPRGARLVMLCKSTVARRIVAFVAAEGLPFAGSLHTIDSQRTFDASVDAVVLSAWPVERGRGVFAMHPSIDAPATRTMAVVGDVVTSDLGAFERTAHLARSPVSGRRRPDDEPAWRSGVKHDAAKVMELSRDEGGLSNGLGERVVVEDEVVYPFLKGSDVANGRPPGARAIVIPQRSLADGTAELAARTPAAHAYLVRHAARFEARKSRVYRGRGRFAVFGIGPYSFAPYKVAVCGLYKRLVFTLVGPHAGKPVLFDDTVTFLPFDDEAEARRVHAALSSNEARAFFEARVFWDAKRPIGKALLASLSIRRLLAALERPSPRADGRPYETSRATTAPDGAEL